MLLDCKTTVCLEMHHNQQVLLHLLQDLVHSQVNHKINSFLEDLEQIMQVVDSHLLQDSTVVNLSSNHCLEARIKQQLVLAHYLDRMLIVH